MTTYSQNMRIREDLLKGAVISPLSALKEYGCFRLSARVHDLRHKYGLPIKTKKLEQINLQGQNKIFAGYYISAEDRKTILEKENNNGI